VYYSVEGAVRYSLLIDDELWRAITKNANAMSALFDQQLEAGTSALRGATMAIDNLERQYQDYAAELRSRYSPILNPEMPSSVGSDQAASLHSQRYAAPRRG
jgi:hypothetical protein